jgi:hypothetical protein
MTNETKNDITVTTKRDYRKILTGLFLGTSTLFFASIFFISTHLSGLSAGILPYFTNFKDLIGETASKILGFMPIFKEGSSGYYAIAATGITSALLSMASFVGIAINIMISNYQNNNIKKELESKQRAGHKLIDKDGNEITDINYVRCNTFTHKICYQVDNQQSI